MLCWYPRGAPQASGAAAEGLPARGFACDLLEGQDPEQACQGSPATWWLTVAAWEEGVVKMTQGLTVSKGFFLFQRVRSVYFRDWVTKLENNIENTGDDS